MSVAWNPNDTSVTWNPNDTSVTWNPVNLILEIERLSEGGVVAATNIFREIAKMNVGDAEVNVTDEGMVPPSVEKTGGMRAIGVTDKNGKGKRFFI